MERLSHIVPLYAALVSKLRSGRTVVVSREQLEGCSFQNQAMRSNLIQHIDRLVNSIKPAAIF